METVKREPIKVSLSASAVRSRVRKAKKMRNEGYTVAKISQELQVVQSAVHRYLSGRVKGASSNYFNPRSGTPRNTKPTVTSVKTSTVPNSGTNTDMLKELLNSNMSESAKLELLRRVVS